MTSIALLTLAGRICGSNIVSWSHNATNLPLILAHKLEGNALEDLSKQTKLVMVIVHVLAPICKCLPVNNGTTTGVPTGTPT